MKAKLIKKFLTAKNRIRMKDCEDLLKDFGYKLHKSGGSHRTFHQAGSKPITIPVPKGTKYVKIEYVKMVIEILKLEA